MTPTTEETTGATKPRAQKKAPAKKSAAKKPATASKPKPGAGGLADAMAEVRAIDAAAEMAKAKPARKPKPKAPRSADANQPSKTDTVIAFLQRPSGATVQEIMEATGWQAHSVRGFLSTAKSKRGFQIERGEDKRYRLTT